MRSAHFGFFRANVGLEAGRGICQVVGMSLDPSVYEKLGAFYLGRPYDLKTKTGADVPLLYDSRDLVTHAVCVGMTGSGKTGLCLALLEEAAMDGVPAIIIDPKGDLGNLLLTFPELRPEDFRPWINEEDARRKGVEPDAFAAQQAEMWVKGLAAWGQSGKRIHELREKVDMAIYTPGSTSGLPVNVLASFDAPEGDDAEALADKVQTTVASLLGLLKIDADPVKGREALFLSALLTSEWKAGHDLSLSAIIELIQHPPFDKIGVLDLETIFPAKDRFGLVMGFNNVLAAPGFATWQTGESLDAGKMLFTKEGKPRLAIFSIAHLGDDERMFFVSLLLNEVLAWTRRQSGTTSLRAILYMDEIFGYLPPTANPPSKLPLLTLLKQARAFGVGVVLATQNPVDLDYKALSNAGTWFIGRLQTERDKARVLDGLQGASGGAKFDRGAMEELLASLGNRIFLMNNVHEDAPVVLETRWVMSYLRGPLTKDQIRILMKGTRPAVEAPPTASDAKPTVRPTISPDVNQIFLANEHVKHLTPRVICSASLRFVDAKLGIDLTRDVIMAARIPEGIDEIDWAAAERLSASLSDFSKEPPKDTEYEAVPSVGTQAKSFTQWEKSLLRSLSETEHLVLWHCPDLKYASRIEESEDEFRARASEDIHKDDIKKLEQTCAAERLKLEKKLERANHVAAREKNQANSARMQAFLSAVSAGLSFLVGKQKVTSATIGKATTAAKSLGRTMKEGGEAAAAEESAADVMKKLDDLQERYETEKGEVGIKMPVIEKMSIPAARGGIAIRYFGLGWIEKGVVK